jgi:hypothetical protein
VKVVEIRPDGMCLVKGPRSENIRAVPSARLTLKAPQQPQCSTSRIAHRRSAPRVLRALAHLAEGRAASFDWLTIASGQRWYFFRRREDDSSWRASPHVGASQTGVGGPTGVPIPLSGRDRREAPDAEGGGGLSRHWGHRHWRAEASHGRRRAHHGR